MSVLYRNQDRTLKATKNYNRFLLHTMAVYTLLLASLAVAQDTVNLQPAALKSIGLREVMELDPNLTGFGVHIAAVCRSMTYENGVSQGDYRFSTDHSALLGANVIFEDGSVGNNGVSSHATAIGGLLLGFDSYGFNPDDGSFMYRGACPDATVEVFEFMRFVGLYVFYGRPFNADIVTLSLGGILPEWWTRGIERMAAEKGVVVFAAAGNGKRVYDPVLYPAAGANVIAVGVVNSVTGPDNRKSLGLFYPPDPNQSSTGPTADDRCKPDIVAPGRCLVPSAISENGYVVEGDWSSLATPITAGAAALLLQKARLEPELAAPMFASNTNNVIKAILLASSDKLPYWHKGRPGTQDDIFYPLDFTQGAGLLNVLSAYKLLTAGWQVPGQVKSTGWDNNVLQSDAAAVYEFHLSEPTGQYVSAVLCWNRIYGSSFPYEPQYDKDNDLQLEFWAIDPDNTQRNILLDISDSVNDNLEHIYFEVDPDYTNYRLVVRQSNLKSSSQNYAIAWTAGQDTSAGNPFWYDLNNDGLVNNVDEMIFFVLEQNQPELLSSITDRSIQLNLSSSRLQSLKVQWPEWRKHLSGWNTVWAGLQNLPD